MIQKKSLLDYQQRLFLKLFNVFSRKTNNVCCLSNQSSGKEAKETDAPYANLGICKKRSHSRSLNFSILLLLLKCINTISMQSFYNFSSKVGSTYNVCICSNSIMCMDIAYRNTNNNSGNPIV